MFGVGIAKSMTNTNFRESVSFQMVQELSKSEMCGHQAKGVEDEASQDLAMRRSVIPSFEVEVTVLGIVERALPILPLDLACTRSYSYRRETVS